MMQALTAEEWLGELVTITATGEQVTRSEAAVRARLTITQLVSWIEGDTSSDPANHGRHYRAILIHLGIAPVGMVV